MSKDTRSIPAAFRGYLLPRSSYQSLIDTCDQLRLLSEFTQSRSSFPERLFIQADALAELFSRAAAHMELALSVIVPDGPEPT